MTVNERREYSFSTLTLRQLKILKALIRIQTKKYYKLNLKPDIDQQKGGVGLQIN